MKRNLEFEKKWNFQTNVNYIDVVKEHNLLIEKIQKSESEKEKELYRKDLHNLLQTYGGSIQLIMNTDYYKMLQNG